MAVPEGMDPKSYQKLRADYLNGLGEKIDSLKTSLNHLKENFNSKDLESLRFILHKFAGNAGMFGFEKVTEICKEWDRKLTEMLKNSEEKLEAGFFHDLEQAICRIQEEFQNGGK